jgi:hypothetical protein
MDAGAGPDIIDALLLLYLPKSKVSVIGTSESEALESSENADPDNISDSEILSPNEEENASVQIPDSVREMEELDAELGLDNCGSEEGLMKALEIFASNASSKADEIENFGSITNFM